MKIYKCDWCGKEIENPNQQNDFFKMEIIDLCKECDEKYTIIEKELIKYDKELKQEFESKMLKKKDELIKNIKKEN